jgi:aspartyl-tRNA(Asn)/glutamyl-tRNA(Gln) amidotransferase subunit C
MASKIDISQVRTVAKLARLQLNEAEATQFSHQLSAILDYIEKLNQLDTQDVEPLAHSLPVSNIFRDDIVIPSLGVDSALANAPERDGSFFKVPRILDDNAGA